VSFVAGEVIYALGLNRTAFDAELVQAEASLTGFAGRASSSLRTLSSGIVTLGFAEIIKQSLDAQQAITRTAVLIADNGKSQKDNIASMGDEVNKITNLTGLGAKKIAEGLYYAKSALGDINLTNQAAEVSAKIAASSGADFTNTLKAIAGAKNAYQSYGVTVAQVGDLIEKATQQGNFSWNEINKYLPNVTSWAADTGIGLKDLLATIDTISKSGLPMATSVTGIRYLIAQLGINKSKEAKELALATGGATFDELIKKGYTLGKVLEIIQTHSKTMNKSLGDIFGVRGGAAAAAFEAQKPGTYESFLAALDNSKGLVDKQLKLTDNPARQMAIAFGDVSAAVRKIVMELSPVIDGITYVVGQTARLVTQVEGIAPVLGLIAARWLTIKGLTMFTATAAEQIAIKKAAILKLNDAEVDAEMALNNATAKKIALEEDIANLKGQMVLKTKMLAANEANITAELKAQDTLLAIRAEKEAVIATETSSIALANAQSATALAVQDVESTILATNMERAALSGRAFALSMKSAAGGIASQALLFLKFWTVFQGFKALTDTERNTGIATKLYGGGLKSFGAGVQLNIMDFFNKETAQKIPFFNNYMKTMTSIPTVSVETPFSKDNPNINENRKLGDPGTQTTDPNAPGYVDPNARATNQLKALDAIFKSDSNYVDLLSAKKNAIDGVIQAQKSLFDAEAALRGARSLYHPGDKHIIDAQYAVNQAKSALKDSGLRSGTFDPKTILQNANLQKDSVIGRNKGLTALNAAHATNEEILYLLEIDKSNPGMLANLAKTGVTKPWLKALDASLKDAQQSNSALTDYIKSITPEVLAAAGDLGDNVGKIVRQRMWYSSLTGKTRLLSWGADGKLISSTLINKNLPNVIPNNVKNGNKLNSQNSPVLRTTFTGPITIVANDPKSFLKTLQNYERTMSGVH
jgi:TP901 family phage tail tape measure protein